MFNPFRSLELVKPQHLRALLTVPQIELLTCGACWDSGTTDEICTLPCGDFFCRTCLETLFVSACKDESMFPPRCCEPIAPDAKYLTREVIREFENKTVEFGTVNRTYCSWDSCAAFIPPDRIDGESGNCPKNPTDLTCTRCKAHWHPDEDCPADEGLAMVLAAGMFSKHRIVK